MNGLKTHFVSEPVCTAICSEDTEFLSVGQDGDISLTWVACLLGLLVLNQQCYSGIDRKLNMAGQLTQHQRQPSLFPPLKQEESLNTLPPPLPGTCRGGKPSK